MGDRAEMASAPIYVIDASALVEIERIASTSDQAAVFHDLADCLDRHELVFCEQVVAELERTSNRGMAHLFAKQGKDSCFNTGATWDVVKKMMRSYQMVDDMESRENASPFVLAQAHEILQSRRNTVLVTEDFRKKLPPLVSLSGAADDLRIPWIRAAAMLRSIRS